MEGERGWKKWRLEEGNDTNVNKKQPVEIGDITQAVVVRALSAHVDGR